MFEDAVCVIRKGSGSGLVGKDMVCALGMSKCSGKGIFMSGVWTTDVCLRCFEGVRYCKFFLAI